MKIKLKDETKNKTKQNVTPEKGNITSVNKTSGGYKFEPRVANQLFSERTSTSLTDRARG